MARTKEGETTTRGLCMIVRCHALSILEDMPQNDLELDTIRAQSKPPPAQAFVLAPSGVLWGIGFAERYCCMPKSAVVPEGGLGVNVAEVADAAAAAAAASIAVEPGGPMESGLAVAAAAAMRSVAVGAEDAGAVGEAGKAAGDYAVVTVSG